MDSDSTNRRDTVLNQKHSNSLSFHTSAAVIKQNLTIKLFEDYLFKQIKNYFYCCYLSVKINNTIIPQLKILVLCFKSLFSEAFSVSC